MLYSIKKTPCIPAKRLTTHTIHRYCYYKPKYSSTSFRLRRQRLGSPSFLRISCIRRSAVCSETHIRSASSNEVIWYGNTLAIYTAKLLLFIHTTKFFRKKIVQIFLFRSLINILYKLAHTTSAFCTWCCTCRHTSSAPSLHLPNT